MSAKKPNAIEWVKNNKAKTIIIAGAAIMLMLFGSSMGSSAYEAENQRQAERITELETKLKEKTGNSKNKDQPKKQKTWQEVTTISGSADKRSPAFELTGNDARLKYTVEGDNFATAYIYLVEEGSSLESEGGFPEVTVTEPSTDETMLAKSAGKYYLDISAVNANWTVTIEELK